MSDPIFSLTVEDAVARVRTRGTALGAYISTRLEHALEDARALAQEPPRSKLHGVPFGLKDEWETLALPTTAGSYRFKDRRSSKDSAVFEVFKDAGAVLIGKTNLSDMGLGPEANSYMAGPARHPLDPTRTAGGSSGGAALAVADGMQGFDWGTDIGGSIRLPSAFCGITGVRLSSQTWPLTDMFPQAPDVLLWMLGQGPMTKNLTQLRAVLEVAAPRLKTGPSEAFEPRGAVLYPPDNGGAWPNFAAEVGPAIKAALGVDRLAPAHLPKSKEMMDVFSGLWSAHLEELLEVDPTINLKEGLISVLSSVFFRGKFGDRRFHPSSGELLALIALGRVTLYRDANKWRTRAKAQHEIFKDVWRQGSIIVAPVCCYPAPKIGRTNYNPHLLACTVAGNIADATGLSIPFGRFKDMPRGIQLMGPPGSEMALIEIAERIR